MVLKFCAKMKPVIIVLGFSPFLVTLDAIISAISMRLFRYAIKNILRSAFLSFSATVVITLMTFLIFILFFAEFVTSSLADSVNSRLSLNVYVKTGLSATNVEVINALEDLKKVDEGIEAKFVSSEEAFEILKKRDPELAKVIESDAENPLPSMITIKNIPLQKYGYLDETVNSHSDAIDTQDEKRKKSLLDYRAQYDRVLGVIKVLIALRYGLFAIIGFFLFSVFVVIFQSIGNAVYYFRHEIKITELVGGQKRYIYGPFAIQGMVYCIFALILSSFFFYFGLKKLDFSFFLGSSALVDRFLENFAPEYLWLSV